MTDIIDDDWEEDDFIDDLDDLESMGEDKFLPERKEKTIIPDLQKYNISEDVMMLADSIYKKDSTKVFRQKNRIFLLYYYTLLASRSIYNNVDPFRLGKLFNITQGQCVKAVNSFNKKRNASMLSFTNPIFLLQSYCKELGINDPEDIEVITTLGREVILRDPTILNTYAQTLAGGILYYYGILYNEKINTEKLETITTRSINTIKKAANDIGLIHNS